MPSRQLVINYGGSGSDSVTPLVIKQEEWSLYTGKVTKQEVVKYLLGIVGEKSYEISVECGMAGEELVVPIYVYPIVRYPDYTLYTSYGALSERYLEYIDIKDELIQFRLTSLESTAFPVKDFISVAWVLSCLGADGEEVTSPPLEINGSDVSTGGVKVFGTAKVSYVTERHSYILTAPRRLEALDNFYSGIVVGVVPGFKPVVHEIEMPPTVESFSSDPSYTCGSAGSGFVNDDEEETPIPDVPSKNLITEVDYCKQTIIREYTE